jgi:hypothetical protein
VVIDVSGLGGWVEFLWCSKPEVGAFCGERQWRILAMGNTVVRCEAAEAATFSLLFEEICPLRGALLLCQICGAVLKLAGLVRCS